MSFGNTPPPLSNNPPVFNPAIRTPPQKPATPPPPIPQRGIQNGRSITYLPSQIRKSQEFQGVGGDAQKTESRKPPPIPQRSADTKTIGEQIIKNVIPNQKPNPSPKVNAIVAPPRPHPPSKVPPRPQTPPSNTARAGNIVAPPRPTRRPQPNLLNRVSKQFTEAVYPKNVPEQPTRFAATSRKERRLNKQLTKAIDLKGDIKSSIERFPKLLKANFVNDELINSLLKGLKYDYKKIDSQIKRLEKELKKQEIALSKGKGNQKALDNLRTTLDSSKEVRENARQLLSAGDLKDFFKVGDKSNAAIKTNVNLTPSQVQANQLMEFSATENSFLRNSETLQKAVNEIVKNKHELKKNPKLKEFSVNLNDSMKNFKAINGSFKQIMDPSKGYTQEKQSELINRLYQSEEYKNYSQNLQDLVILASAIKFERHSDFISKNEKISQQDKEALVLNANPIIFNQRLLRHPLLFEAIMKTARDRDPAIATIMGETHKSLKEFSLATNSRMTFVALPASLKEMADTTDKLNSFNLNEIKINLKNFIKYEKMANPPKLNIPQKDVYKNFIKSYKFLKENGDTSGIDDFLKIGAESPSLRKILQKAGRKLFTESEYEKFQKYIK